MNIEQIAKRLLAQPKWDELKKGEQGERAVIGTFKRKGIKIIEWTSKKSNDGADIVIQVAGKNRKAEVKYLEGVSGGRVCDKLVFEVITSSGLKSHALRDNTIDYIIFYNNTDKSINVFNGVRFRKFAQDKLDREQTCRLPDDCKGIKAGWAEKEAGHILTLESK